MSRSERRAERIRTDVPIERVLSHYGYEVLIEGGSREQQFRCDLHGDGMDGKPSARCYPGTNSWFCWACNQSRDSIQTVREKEGVSFYAAMDRLEKLFGLPPLAWEEGDRDEGVDVMAGAFDAPVRSLGDEVGRVGKIILALYKERSLPLPQVLILTEEYDHLCALSEASPDDAKDQLLWFRQRLVDSQRIPQNAGDHCYQAP